MKNILYAVLFLVTVSACRTEVEPPKEIGQALYPLNIGREVVYKVDSIVYDDFLLRPDNKPDTFTFQLKEVIDSKFLDNNGKQAYRVMMYKRLNDSFNWEPYKAISASVDVQSMQRVEDNTRYLKLAFPVAENKRWNSNVYNTKNQTNSEYKDIYTTYTTGGFILDSSVTVVHEDDSNFVEKRLTKEIYVSSVGLVSGRYDYVNYQIYNQTTQRYYWKGLLFRKSMISFKP